MFRRPVISTPTAQTPAASRYEGPKYGSSLAGSRPTITSTPARRTATPQVNRDSIVSTKKDKITVPTFIKNNRDE